MSPPAMIHRTSEPARRQKHGSRQTPRHKSRPNHQGQAKHQAHTKRAGWDPNYLATIYLATIPGHLI
jgi:hypothetical protein